MRKIVEFAQVFWFGFFMMLAVAWCGHIAGAY